MKVVPENNSTNSLSDTYISTTFKKALVKLNTSTNLQRFNVININK